VEELARGRQVAARGFIQAIVTLAALVGGDDSAGSELATGVIVCNAVKQAR